MGKVKHLPPEKNPHIGCANCGGGEMQQMDDVILARMDTRIYGSYGGWTIMADDKIIYDPPINLEWKKYPTLAHFEEMARKDPDKDWRAILNMPLRDAIYQRQGENRWVLVKSGLGFA